MEIFKNHPHWPHVLEVCKKITSSGFVAWLAGGCVRDLLLNCVPKDFDIVTDGLPDQIQALFPNSLDIGKQFGIIIVPFAQATPEPFQIEIATFRSDGEYADGRHPLNVQFSNPVEDSKRRDFTVNAMYFDPLTQSVHDYVHGQDDLKRKLLKAVGIPQKRFEEDKLRMLRAIRFSAQLDFEIESDTLSAIQKYASQIHVVSAERIQQELKKLFESKNIIRGLEYFAQSGLHKEVFKSFTKISNFDEIFNQSTQLLRKAQGFDPVEKLYLFLYPFFTAPVGLEVIETFLLNTKYPRDVQRRLLNLFEKTRWIKAIEQRTLGERILMSHSLHSVSFMRIYSYLIAQSLKDSLKFQLYEEAFHMYESLPKPLVNGHDLMTLGFPPGCDMGERLQKIYHHQLENQINDKQTLLRWTKEQKI